VNDHEKQALGLKAKELLENTLLQKTLSSLEDFYTSAWKTAKTVEAREDAYRYVQLCKKFISDIEAVTKDGQFSEHRIKELEGQKGGLLKIWR
jgi:hypothetical protein